MADLKTRFAAFSRRAHIHGWRQDELNEEQLQYRRTRGDPVRVAVGVGVANSVMAWVVGLILPILLGCSR